MNFSRIEVLGEELIEYDENMYPYSETLVRRAKIVAMKRVMEREMEREKEFERRYKHDHDKLANMIKSCVSNIARERERERELEISGFNKRLLALSLAMEKKEKEKKKKKVFFLTPRMEKEVVKAGIGGTFPRIGQIATIHCDAFGKDGDPHKIFWSTKDPTLYPYEPFTFKIGKVDEFMGIARGWVEAVLQMQIGEVARLWCSPCYAFGRQGFVGIPPYTAVVFKIELLKVVDEDVPLGDKVKEEKKKELKLVNRMLSLAI